MKYKEPLKNHTSYKIGGIADRFIEAKTPENIIKSIRFAKKHDLPYLLIGSGTNILFSDKGFRGIVIKNLTNKTTIQKNIITADSGTKLALIAQKIPYMTGIPGTIGGAVYGNAGIPGHEIKNYIKSIEAYDPEEDKILTLTATKFSYRHSEFKENKLIILKVTLKISKTAPKTAKRQLVSRAKKQPYGMSAGSFFKNPSSDRPAGFLIDQTGLKGFKHGEAQISEKHANFFLNLGNATQKDILELAKTAYIKVKQKFGISLETEVQIFDEHGAKIEIS